MKPFDPDAQARMTELFRTCPPEEFRKELDTYAPRTSAEYARYHLYQGWALYDEGHYRNARTQLLRALKWSNGGSRERSLAYGLLAESFLRVGEFARAEQYTRRALAHGCDRDPNHFVQAGHFLTLGRIQGLRGHLDHGMETARRALTFVDPHSPHWVPLWMIIAQGSYYRGVFRDADLAVRAARKGEAGHHQGWVIATVECPLALALGDIDRADQVVRETIGTFFYKVGARVRYALMEMEASVLHARGKHRESETILRSILSGATLGGTNSDAVPSASRALAGSLMAQERFAEALELCRLASKGGTMDDHAEWATALRLKGECHLAVGAIQEARRAFLQAMSVHAMTQFDAERARLENAVHRTSFRDSMWIVRQAPRRRTDRLRRFHVRSGGVFLVSDCALVSTLQLAARSDLPVLIEGETGTGKELVATLIHELGPRAEKPFVVVDCSSLPESLADVELFGAARGAYTDAVRDRTGLIAQADGGTLLLDELPELTTRLQAKLLRVIQEGHYRRIGEDRPRRVRVRFIAATNRPIEKLLDAGDLKPDLFYRLGGHRIALQPLRARKHEVGPLAVEIARRAGLSGVSRDAIKLLVAQPWPGNVRQLEMVVRLAASAAAPGSALERAPVLACLTEARLRREPVHDGGTLRSHRAAAERATLERALAECGGVVADAARSLGISRQSFYKALHRTGLK